LPSGKRHYRITLADALSAHDRALQFGGLEGVIDIGRIEAAIARPYSGYHRPITHKAAALVEALTQNHGFTDGNKRTTYLLMYVLLDNSDYELVFFENDIYFEIANMIVAAADGRMAFDDLVVWFRGHIRRVADET
jgi:death-on-curing protein